MLGHSLSSRRSAYVVLKPLRVTPDNANRRHECLVHKHANTVGGNARIEHCDAPKPAESIRTATLAAAEPLPEGRPSFCSKVRAAATSASC